MIFRYYLFYIAPTWCDVFIEASPFDTGSFTFICFWSRIMNTSFILIFISIEIELLIYSDFILKDGVLWIFLHQFTWNNKALWVLYIFLGCILPCLLIDFESNTVFVYSILILLEPLQLYQITPITEVLSFKLHLDVVRTCMRVALQCVLLRYHQQNK